MLFYSCKRGLTCAKLSAHISETRAVITYNKEKWQGVLDTIIPVTRATFNYLTVRNNSIALLCVTDIEQQRSRFKRVFYVCVSGSISRKYI